MRDERVTPPRPTLWLVAGALALAALLLALTFPRGTPDHDAEGTPVRALAATFELPATPTPGPRATGIPPSVTPPPLPPALFATATPAPPAADAAPADPAAPPAPPAATTFEVRALSLPLYQGPDERYPRVGVVAQGELLTVSGRTVDGGWWLVCCAAGVPGWLRPGADGVVASGDLEAMALYTLPPLPTSAPPRAAVAPPPPAPAAPTARPPSAPPSALPPAPPTRPPAATPTARPSPTPDLGPPLVGNPACAVEGAAYATIPVLGASSVRPAHRDPELNIAMRGWVPSAHHAHTLWDYPGDIDPLAPRFQTLFGDRRVPRITTLQRVREWDWQCDCPGDPIAIPEVIHSPQDTVTLTGFEVTPGEPLLTPDRPPEGEIGGGYRAMVLYVDSDSITLKYTREDNIIYGYAIHIEGICVEPRLVALYDQMNRAGRRSLPALNGLQPLGRAIGGEILFSIRDSGAFMDPRVEKDWWQGAR